MSDTDLLAETVKDLLASAEEAGSASAGLASGSAPDAPASGPARSADAAWDPRLWAQMEELGLTGIGISEEAGGSGGTLADAAVVVRACGYHAAAVPFADHAFVAAWALASAGIPLPEGPLSVVLGPPAGFTTGDGDSATVTGTLPAVPWGRNAARIVVVAGGAECGETRVALIDPAHAQVTEGSNLAGEPRDDVTFDGAPATVRTVRDGSVDTRTALARGALARALALTGAARRVLDLTVRYAGEREQFGRPIGRFQAVQSELAELAGAVEQADAMADQAVALAGAEPSIARAAAAAAKICAGRAAGIAKVTGHQLHGAIGFTEEHVLHHYTGRLLAWRDEHGAEALWSAELGDAVAAGGADGLWWLLTSGGVDA